MAECDADQNASLDWPEVEACVTRYQAEVMAEVVEWQAEEMQWINDMFNLADTDASGDVSYDELVALFNGGPDGLTQVKSNIKSMM
jgi:Ca2+-binding EF-hand superfamily protein